VCICVKVSAIIHEVRALDAVILDGAGVGTGAHTAKLWEDKKAAAEVRIRSTEVCVVHWCMVIFCACCEFLAWSSPKFFGVVACFVRLHKNHLFVIFLCERQLAHCASVGFLMCILYVH
jgi:hypothetical protein